MQQKKKTILVKKEKILNETSKSETLERDEIRRSAVLSERATMNNAKIRNNVTFVEME
ncbi:hypothetical protein [Vibrio cincinnatiensis]|uniref:hypothetical protein n=1 Tax=Vibrio cincinnatiensis TaxID=675 RepID=UPI0013023667|nr:hypothetical protein [Vibrio cincinnatiensis]